MYPGKGKFEVISGTGIVRMSDCQTWTNDQPQVVLHLLKGSRIGIWNYPSGLILTSDLKWEKKTIVVAPATNVYTVQLLSTFLFDLGFNFGLGLGLGLINTL